MINNINYFINTKRRNYNFFYKKIIITQKKIVFHYCILNFFMFFVLECLFFSNLKILIIEKQKMLIEGVPQLLEYNNNVNTVKKNYSGTTCGIGYIGK